jgi:hypothetical protein
MAIANRTIREGVVGGLLAAGAVALWFLILDVLTGRPFATPVRLGEAVGSLFGGTGGASPTLYVLGYTLFHVLAFILSGIVMSAVVNKAEEEPSLLFGVLILFVAFEIAWYGMTAILSRDEAFGPAAWWQIMLANLVAAGVMGVYLFRKHPMLASRASRSLAGEA